MTSEVIDHSQKLEEYVTEIIQENTRLKVELDEIRRLLDREGFRDEHRSLYSVVCEVLAEIDWLNEEKSDRIRCDECEEYL